MTGGTDAAPVSVLLAEIREATVTIKCLVVEGRQVTMATFRQLSPLGYDPFAPDAKGPDAVWGYINYFWTGCGDAGEGSKHFVVQVGDELRRSRPKMVADKIIPLRVDEFGGRWDGPVCWEKLEFGGMPLRGQIEQGGYLNQEMYDAVVIHSRYCSPCASVVQAEQRCGAYVRARNQALAERREAWDAAPQLFIAT